MRLWRRLSDRRGLPGSGSVDWLIVGLGNPGPSYERTRHNAGYRVVAHLAERHGFAWASERHRSRLAQGRVRGKDVVLAQPLTYVNRSGRAVAPLSRELRLAPSRVLVAYDDLDLPPGQIRLRPGGGAGGHRGMDSVLRSLESEEVPRMRIGVGRPPEGMDPVEYVLAQLSEAELEDLEPVVGRAADALEMVVTLGMEAAMTRVNSRGARDNRVGSEDNRAILGDESDAA